MLVLARAAEDLASESILKPANRPCRRGARNCCSALEQECWNSGITGHYPTRRRSRELGGLQSGHDGFNFALRVIPGHAHFPAQAQVQGEVRFHLVSVLNICATISGARIQELLAALVIIDGAPIRKSAKSVTRFAAIKSEISVGRAGIALIDSAGNGTHRRI